MRWTAALALALPLAAQAAMGPDDARHLLNRTGFGAQPHEIAEYAALPRTEAVERLLAGLHPSLAPLMPLRQSRELAIVQGVGYPSPNLSHFRSIEIWDTASRAEEYLADGWLARAFAAAPVPKRFAADGVVVGASELGPLAGGGARAVALANTEQFLRQAKLAQPTRGEGNRALAHLLKVEADVVQAASGLNGNREFRTQFPQKPFGNLGYAVDFRSLYATVLERWWGVPAAGPLGGGFSPVDLVKAA